MTSTTGNVDTYTIHYTDNTTSTFTVTNGVDGAVGPQGPQGEQGPQGLAGKGIASFSGPVNQGTTHTYTMTYTDGTASTIVVNDGQDGEGVPQTLSLNGDQLTISGGNTVTIPINSGAPGRGITEITGPVTSGNVDTYTIHYNDNTTSTFSVTIPTQCECLTTADVQAMINSSLGALQNKIDSMQQVIDSLGLIVDTAITHLGFYCGSSTVTDYDGNTYNTVQIGDQCWMKENLRTTHYADGTDIPAGGSNTSATDPYYYINPNADATTYGYYYNWPAAMHGAASSNSNPSNVQGVCPVGWHLPSDAEWTTMTDYVKSQNEFTCGGNSSNIAKALASTDEWNNSGSDCAVGNNPAANNARGFSVVPAGEYYSNDYDASGSYANFWSAAEASSDRAWERYLYYSSARVYRGGANKGNVFSVRCIRGAGLSVPTVSTDMVSSIGSTTATCSGEVTANGGAEVTARGVCWSTSQHPTVSDSHTEDGTGTGAFTSSLTGLTPSTTYYVRAYATNSEGTAYGEEVSYTTNEPADGDSCPGTSTVTDYDGNTYNTVKIGQQCWMKENLRTTHYADGTDIPAGGSNTSYTDPYYYDYSSSSIPLAQRGYLYNWPAAMHGAASSNSNPSNVQGVCPTGWHLPSDAEWTQLTDYVGSQSEYTCGGNGSNIAKALASTEGWNNIGNACAVGNNPAANNATGFSAVPAGNCYGSSFDDAGYYASFWSSTQYDGNDAYRRALTCYYAYVSRYDYYKGYGFSVRCLRD